VSDRPPESDDTQRLREEADAAIDRYKSYLQSPTFQHSLDVAVLTKIAGDEKADIRERRRAAEVLAKLRLQAMEGLASLVAARDQTLDRLGIRTGSGPSLSMTQVNNRIEIVRASDWRNAAPLEEGEAVVDVLPEGSPATSGPEANGHETNGHARVHAPDDDDAPDPAA
jgi:hypothetical protein